MAELKRDSVHSWAMKARTMASFKRERNRHIKKPLRARQHRRMRSRDVQFKRIILLATQ
jgi:hypothetical protein